MNTPEQNPAELAEKARLMQEERNWMALFLSILPGLGQLYKGYTLMGIAIMVVGIPATIWAAALLFLATFGVGLLLIPIAWGIVAIHAFTAEDHRRHHIGIL